MQEQVYEQLTLFQEVSPASRFPWLESKKVGRTTVISGQRCEGLSPSLSHVGYSVRTYLESCELLLPTSYRTWSVSAITSSCLILKQRVSVPRTTESELGLWPTVTVCGNNQHRGAGPKAGMGLATAVRMWPTPIAGNCGMTATTGGRPIEKSTKLQTQVMLEEKKRLFPTVKASDSKGSGPKGSKSAEHDLKRGNLKGYIMYATPQARDYRTGQSERWENLRRSRNLNDQCGGQLNPTWVEWLMGFPIGWTELKD